MGTPLVIVGAGGHGREVLDVAEAVGGHTVLGFVDDGSPDLTAVEARGHRLLGDVASLASLGPVLVVVAIGDAQARLDVAARALAIADVTAVPALVHPDATVGTRCTIGPGTVVAAGARITTNVTIGAHCYLGPNATVGHDSRLLDGASLYPGSVVSGDVTVGRAATIGAAAAVKQGLTVGAASFVALGAGVVHDVPEGATVAGTPAKRLHGR